MDDNQDDLLASLVSVDQKRSKNTIKNKVMVSVIKNLTKDQKTIPISVRLKESDIDTLKKIAKKNGTKVSSVVSQIVSTTLAEYSP